MDADLRDIGIANEKANSAICKMPWHVLERSFAFLSWHWISKLSNVCEEWKTTFHSTHFRSLRITRQQWFIVLERDSQKNKMHCWVYDFTIKQWKELPVSLFPTHNPVRLFSDAGQEIVESRSPNSCQAIWLWNPVSQMVLELSPIHQKYTTVAFSHRDNKEWFTVLGIGSHKIGIYCFGDKRWRTVAYLPRDFSVIKVVCCNGFVFMMGVDPAGAMKGVMVYDIQHFRLVKFAPTPVSISNCKEGDLLVCGSCVLFVGGNVEEWKFKDMSIWELHLNDSEEELWKKIADMPSPMLEEMLMLEEEKNWVYCDGVEDYMCFRGYQATKTVVFNLTYQCWSYLPERPVVFEYPAWTLASAFYTNRERPQRSR